MATATLKQFFINHPSNDELSNYKQDPLLSYCMDLIDRSSEKKIKEIYDYFTTDIMKYLLKTIIEQKISDVFSDENNDTINIFSPKTELFEQLIDKLKPIITKREKKNEQDTHKDEENEDHNSNWLWDGNEDEDKDEDEDEDKDKDEDTDEPSDHEEDDTEEPSDHEEIQTSTTKLLLDGYVRHEIQTKKMPSSDLRMLLEKFIGNASNLFDKNNLILFKKCKNKRFALIQNIFGENINASFQSKRTISTTQNPLELFNENTIKPVLAAPDMMLSINEAQIIHNDPKSIPSLSVPAMSTAEKECFLPNIPREFKTGDYLRQWTQYLDIKRKRLLGIDKSGRLSSCLFDSESVLKWENINTLASSDEYAFSKASICNILDDYIAIIGKRNNVVLYDCNTDYFVSLRKMNKERYQCGLFHDEYTHKMIAFGGEGGQSSLELYDFHKNKWMKWPYLSNNKYPLYPCVWTIGGQCIFVAGLHKKRSYKLQCNFFGVHAEWIDLRVCDRSGNNKSKWNKIPNNYKWKNKSGFKFCSLFYVPK